MWIAYKEESGEVGGVASYSRTLTGRKAMKKELTKDV